MQREEIRVEGAVGAREVDAEVLLGTVGENVRDLILLDGRLEERIGVDGGWEVVDRSVDPVACCLGVRERGIYPGAKLGVVDTSLNGCRDKRAFEPVPILRELRMD